MVDLILTHALRHAAIQAIAAVVRLVLIVMAMVFATPAAMTMAWFDSGPYWPSVSQRIERVIRFCQRKLG